MPQCSDIVAQASEQYNEANVMANEDTLCLYTGGPKWCSFPAFSHKGTKSLAKRNAWQESVIKQRHGDLLEMVRIRREMGLLRHSSHAEGGALGRCRRRGVIRQARAQTGDEIEGRSPYSCFKCEKRKKGILASDTKSSAASSRQ
ncbi:uncharacterized protein [Dermacentor albipictus]|uniref:uncharacterized protein isoform X2 n=1 Tax=Dermacentor albipictus TaxID=60249 RepID=UPI0038FD0AA6